MKHSPIEYEGSVELNNDIILVLISRLGWLNYLKDFVVEIRSKRYGEHNFLILNTAFTYSERDNQDAYQLSSTVSILDYYKIIRHNTKESEGEVPISKIGFSSSYLQIQWICGLQSTRKGRVIGRALALLLVNV